MSSSLEDAPPPYRMARFDADMEANLAAHRANKNSGESAFQVALHHLSWLPLLAPPPGNYLRLCVHVCQYGLLITQQNC